jgi:hypothetical protein
MLSAPPLAAVSHLESVRLLLSQTSEERDAVSATLSPTMMLSPPPKDKQTRACLLLLLRRPSPHLLNLQLPRHPHRLQKLLEHSSSPGLAHQTPIALLGAVASNLESVRLRYPRRSVMADVDLEMRSPMLMRWARSKGLGVEALPTCEQLMQSLLAVPQLCYSWERVTGYATEEIVLSESEKWKLCDPNKACSCWFDD